MKNVFTLEWLKAAGIRAINTVAQTAIAALAGVLSILTSVAGLPEVAEK